MRCFWTTSVAFEKEFSLKAKAYLAKRLFDSIEVLNLRKNVLYLQMERKSSIEYSVVFLVEGEKFQVTKFALEDFIFVFFMAKSLSCSETQPSKLLMGLRYMILSIMVKEIMFLKWEF